MLHPQHVRMGHVSHVYDGKLYIFGALLYNAHKRQRLFDPLYLFMVVWPNPWKKNLGTDIWEFDGQLGLMLGLSQHVRHYIRQQQASSDY